MAAIFCAVKRFTPATRTDWQQYIEWSGLTQLQEVISLDLLLCPMVTWELTNEDWKHNVHEDNRTDFFHDLEYLVARIGDKPDVNILAVMHNPTHDDIRSFADPRFEFRGFDLIERDTSISALVNCGGFPKAFSTSELSECGLLIDHSRALEVQKLLRAEYPHDPHANCEISAIWQMAK